METAGRHLGTRPGLLRRYPAAEVRCIEDGEFHVRHLASALAMGRPELFEGYLVWTGGLLAGYGMDPEELVAHVETLVQVVASVPEVDEDDAAAVRDVVVRGVTALSAAPVASVSFLSPDHPHGELARDFLDALLEMDRQRASRMVADAADAGVPIEELYLHVFQPCLREMGRLWETRGATVAQEHFVTAAVQMVMAQLYPRLFATPRVGRSVLVASVGGELHELGGRMLGVRRSAPQNRPPECDRRQHGRQHGLRRPASPTGAPPRRRRHYVTRPSGPSAELRRQGTKDQGC